MQANGVPAPASRAGYRGQDRGDRDLRCGRRRLGQDGGYREMSRGMKERDAALDLYRYQVQTLSSRRLSPIRVLSLTCWLRHDVFGPVGRERLPVQRPWSLALGASIRARKAGPRACGALCPAPVA
jgi:hypothetical protein